MMCLALLSTTVQGIALLSEYTTIGSLFADFVGSEAWPMVSQAASRQCS